MRYRDQRQTIIKRIGGNDRRDDAATPRRLSPMVHERPRKGVHPRDILTPTHNRASRRQLGITRTRTRINGVALAAAAQPWKDTETE